MKQYWIRLTAILFLILLQRNLSGQGVLYMQETFREKSLSEIFHYLERKYGVKFAFDEAAVASTKVSTRIRANSLSEALEQLFSGTGFVYQIPAPGQVLLRKEIKTPTLPSITPRSLSGQVLDGWSGAPLPFAHILFGENQGVAADEAGKFSIPAIPDAPSVQLQVQYIGYHSRNITLGAAQQSLTIRLTPSMEALPGITVKDRAPVLSRQQGTDGTALHGQSLARMSYFVGGKDLFRGLQMLPGVNAADDLSADLSIRSSNGDENLVLLDGITLYNVTHFFGIFSIVNPNIVDQVKVYKNAFPAEFGGRTAAVIDMHTQPMRREGWKGMVDLNALTSNAVVEAPIGNRMSLLAGFRTANRNLGNSDLFNQATQTDEVVATFLRGRTTTARTITSQQPNFYFNDGNVKWTWKPSEKTNVLFSYFRGRDRFEYDFSRTIFPPSRRPTNFLKETYAEDARWKNEGAAFHWQQHWSRSLSSALVVSRSGYENITGIGSTFSRFADSILLPPLKFENNHFNQVKETNVQLKNSYQFRKEQDVQLGYQGAFSQVAFQIAEDGMPRLKGDRYAPQHSLFAQYKTGKLLDRFSADAGFRFTTFQNKLYGSPRLYLQADIGRRTYFKASYGLYHQFVRQLYHEDRSGRTFQYWVLSDARFPVATSGNSMLGFSHKNKLFDIDVELYSKSTDGIMEHALKRTGLYVVDGKPVIPTYVLFAGKGQTIGMDILLQKSTPDYALWAAYTLSKSTHRFPQVAGGRPYPAPNDRRHQLKLNAQYTIGRFDMGATYVFASGRPYTDLSLLEVEDGDRTKLEPEERLENLEDYHRLDIFGNYTFPLWGVEGKLGVNLYNVTNHDNVKFRQFIYSFQSPPEPGSPPSKNPVNTVVGGELEMLGFTPNISFQIKF
ncbi:MAG: carboxypeptidase-like regulatory domain-containing protein [Haliscomenobacter sp.]